MSAIGSLVHEFGPWTLATVALAALVTSSIHGTVGVAGGFIMTAALALLIGVRPVVPVMSVALLVSHGSRSLLNLRDFDRTVFAAIIWTAIPMIVIGAFAYGVLPVPAIALVLGIVILSSIPVRHWTRSRDIKAGKRTLTAVGGIYGLLAGASIGPGMLLTPFMLGYGMTKEAFVATMAAVAFSTNVTRILVFGGTQLLDAQYVLLGILVGLATIPGNWLGRTVLRRMTAGTHDRLIDGFAVFGGLNFLYLAAAS